MSNPVLIIDERGVHPNNLDAAIREQDAYYGRKRMANDPKEMTITIAQAISLIRKWQQQNADAKSADAAIKLEDFLGQVSPTIGCDGAVTVPWAGMWLCIEKDGYTHS